MAETLENPEDKVRNNCISVERSKQFMRTVTAPARSPRRDHMDHYHHSCSEDLRMKGKKMMRAAPRAEATRAREDIRRSLFRKDFLPQGGVRRRPERCTYLLPRLREARRRRRGLPRIGSSRRQAPRRAAGGNGELGAPHNILYKHHV